MVHAGVLHRRCSASPTRPSRSRTASAGAATDAETILRGLDAAWNNDREHGSRAAGPGALPDARHPGIRRSDCRTRRGPAVAAALTGTARAGRVRGIRAWSAVCVIRCASTSPCGTSSPGTRRRRGDGSRRGISRRRRALYVSSPIGLGHARRDVAIADELRRLHPDLEIEWLAQHPMTAVLEPRGERVHPASAELASESAHIRAESAGTACRASRPSAGWTRSCWPTSWCSSTWSRTSRTTCGSATRHGRSTTTCTRTPSSRSAAYAWLTDFVGWLPMPDGGEREASLTADYNAEMIEQIARYPRVRDRAIFVGDPATSCPALRPRAARDPRMDRAPLRLLRLHHGLRPGRGRRPRRAARRARIRATTKRCASSRSAAQGWASTCSPA